jgi:mannose-6-phosphate isomerase-like protein (cupin superfamily)
MRLLFNNYLRHNYAIISLHIINKIKLMKGFISNIEKDTLENENFRKVVYTGKHSQLVLMSLAPSEEIGMEVHNDNDQFFRFEKGQGKVIIDGNEYEVKDGTAVVVPAGAQHNVINVSATDRLSLYTIYSPAHHQDGIVRATKAEAESNEADFDGKTTE